MRSMEFRQFTQVGRNLTFDSPEGTFNLRVAAIIRCNDHVLLHRALADDFWALPGGRPQHFESAKDALRRELREEIGEMVTVGDLVTIIEVHFEQTHEIDLCFEVTLPNDSRLRELDVEHDGDEFGVPLLYRWFSEDQLTSLRLLPRPVADALTRRRAQRVYWFDDERALPPESRAGRDLSLTVTHRFNSAVESRAAGVAYHLAPIDVWQRQRENETYKPEAFDSDGFIHTTNGLDPLLAVANLFYQGDKREYRVLVLSVPNIDADVRYDDADRIYPHIYGPLNTSAVITELPVRRGHDGAFLAFD